MIGRDRPENPGNHVQGRDNLLDQRTSSELVGLSQNFDQRRLARAAGPPKQIEADIAGSLSPEAVGAADHCFIARGVALGNA